MQRSTTNYSFYYLTICLFAISCNLNTQSKAPSTTPKVVISDISDITFEGVKVVFDVVENGGDSVTKKGICWSIKNNPKTSDFTTEDGVGLGTYFSRISDLKPGKTYFIRAYATNKSGTAYSTQKTFTTKALEIGSQYKGGIVAYILEPEDNGYIEGEIHGLIMGPYNKKWGCWGICQVSINTDTRFGSGKSNTDKIASQCPNGAASWCKSLTINGYSDWYLPSIEELNKIYSLRKINGLSPLATIKVTSFWSSSEYSDSQAYIITLGFDTRGIDTSDPNSAFYNRHVSYADKADYGYYNGWQKRVFLPVRSF
jgi:hypothetical protein